MRTSENHRRLREIIRDYHADVKEITMMARAKAATRCLARLSSLETTILVESKKNLAPEPPK